MKNTRKNKPITVKGNVILSTIATMETFGDIGRQVLADYGVTKIDENKLYPFELRNRLHKALLDRFGEDALMAFGFSNGESFQTGVVKETQREYVRNQGKLLSGDYADHSEALKNILQCLVNSIDKLIKKNSQSIGIDYGARLDVLGRNKFRYTFVTASMPYQSSFMFGTTKFHFAKFFEKFWEYKLTVDQDQTVSGYGFTRNVYNIVFKRKLSKLSQSEIVTNRKMEIRDQLIRSVLRDSNRQVAKIESLLTQLGKYTPPHIHDALAKGEHDTEIATRRKKLTIFFSDIANFTSTSEGLQPEDLTKYLNEYFSEMTAIAIKYGATIDKYIGDAMMLFFGDPISKGEREDARSCVEMALRMQEQITILQTKWRNEGFADPFQVRMGINTGYCNVGNFGSDQRLTYTIIGGEVNVAQRLEAGSDADGILMSYETYAHAQDIVEVEERETIQMKGISREIKVFSVITSKAKSKKAKVKIKQTKKEVSQIRKLEKDMEIMRRSMRDMNKNIEMLLKKI